jgi:hypothetical protein
LLVCLPLSAHEVTFLLASLTRSGLQPSFPTWPIRCSAFQLWSASIASSTAWPITPSADFCPVVRRPHGPLSRCTATPSRSPGVSSIAFNAQPPNLRFASLMNMDFAMCCPLVRRWRLLFGSCSSARIFDPRFLQTPPRGGSPCVSLTLHLHQVGWKTSTSELLNMPGTQRTRLRGSALRAVRSSWHDGGSS